MIYVTEKLVLHDHNKYKYLIPKNLAFKDIKKDRNNSHLFNTV